MIGWQWCQLDRMQIIYTLPTPGLITTPALCHLIFTCWIALSDAKQTVSSTKGAKQIILPAFITPPPTCDSSCCNGWAISVICVLMCLSLCPRYKRKWLELSARNMVDIQRRMAVWITILIVLKYESTLTGKDVKWHYACRISAAFRSGYLLFPILSIWFLRLFLLWTYSTDRAFPAKTCAIHSVQKKRYTWFWS